MTDRRRCLKVWGLGGIGAAAAAPAALTFAALTFVVLTLAVLGSCGLVNLEAPPDYEIFPSRYGAVIAKDDLPRVSFTGEVNRESVEAIFSINDAEGKVVGRYIWEGRTLRFRPDEPFLPARRYQLRFRGVFLSREGRSVQVLEVLPFFVGLNNSAALTLVSAAPPPGSTIDRRTELELTFSRNLDKTNIEDIVTVTPELKHDLIVTGGKLRLVPNADWPNVSRITLGVGAKLQSTAGVRLPADIRLVYWAQSDKRRPVVDRVSAAFDNSRLGFPEIPGPPASGADNLKAKLGAKNLIAIQFSEAMDRDSVTKALTVFPENDHAAFWFSDNRLLLRPKVRWSPSTDYTLTITTEAKDSAGLSPASDYIVSFRPASAAAVPAPRVTFGSLSPPRTADTVKPSEPLRISVGPSSPGNFTFRIDFPSASFTNAADRAEVLAAVNVRVLFPSAGAPVLTSADWNTNSRLTLEYTNFQPSNTTTKYYYRFTLGAIDGSREIRQLLETQP